MNMSIINSTLYQTPNNKQPTIIFLLFGGVAISLISCFTKIIFSEDYNDALKRDEIIRKRSLRRVIINNSKRGGNSYDKSTDSSSDMSIDMSIDRSIDRSSEPSYPRILQRSSQQITNFYRVNTSVKISQVVPYNDNNIEKIVNE